MIRKPIAPEPKVIYAAELGEVGIAQNVEDKNDKELTIELISALTNKSMVFGISFENARRLERAIKELFTAYEADLNQCN